MTMPLIVAHTADWHVGPSEPKTDPTGLNQRLVDRANCAAATISGAVAAGADILLHAGDFWGGPRGVGLGSRPSATEVRMVKDALAPAIEAGIPIVAILGNHDDPKSGAEKNALDHLREMEGVTVVDRPGIVQVWAGGATGTKYRVIDWETDAADDEVLALELACLPFPNTQLLLRDEQTRQLSHADRNELIRQKMMDVARGLTTNRIEGVPRVLLGHFAVDTAAAGANHLAMLGSEWSLNVHELVSLGFDMVCLGHYHKPQTLHVDSDAPCQWIGYCGSPEAINHGEGGEEKGWMLHDLANHSHALEPTPYRRFVTLTGKDFAEDGTLVDPAGAKDAIVRVKLGPNDGLDDAEIRSQLETAGVHDCGIERERAETVRRRESDIKAEMAPGEAVREWVRVVKPELGPQADKLAATADRVAAAAGIGGAA